MSSLRGEWKWWIFFLAAVVALGGREANLPGALLFSVPVVIPGFLFLLWLDRLPPFGLNGWVRGLAWGILIAAFLSRKIHLLVTYIITQRSAAGGWATVEEGFSLAGSATSLLSAPIVEELLKGFFPLLLLWSRTRPVFGPWQGLFAGTLSALAFGLMENATYLVLDMPFAEGAAVPLTARWLHPYLHVLFTVPFALAIGFSGLLPTLSQRVAIIFTGYLLSVGTHACWNWDVLYGKEGGSIFSLIRHGLSFTPFFVAVILWGGYVLESRSLRSYGAKIQGALWWPCPHDRISLRRASLRRIARHFRKGLSREPLSLRLK